MLAKSSTTPRIQAMYNFFSSNEQHFDHGDIFSSQKQSQILEPSSMEREAFEMLPLTLDC
jgi:hypothetical protein